jgi:cytochrome P450
MHRHSPIPQLPGLPLLGNLLEFRDRRLTLLRRAADLGDICLVSLAGMRVVLVSSAELAHAVLVQQPNVFVKGMISLDLFPTILGRGLLTSTGEEHRRHRKLLTPVFSPRRFAGYLPLIGDEIEQATSGWRTGDTIDLAAEMVRLNLSITLRTIFGSERRSDVRVVVGALSTALAALERSITGLVRVPFSWPTPNNLKRTRAVERLDRVVARIIADRRANPRDDGSLLQLLLQARDEDDGGGLSDQEVRDQIITFFAAGTDTLAHALGWSWYLLMRHPAALERVQAEADGLVDDARLPADAMARLPYTAQVLKEAMRLYSPSYVHDRRSASATELGGHRLPANTPVWINAFGIHHRADYYPEPERFEPGRFEPLAERQLPKCAYLPFGSGPRACIGAGLALASGPLIMALLARRFRFLLLPEPRVEPMPRFTLSPKQGIPARVELRSR